jgi:hypothetical protein
MPGNPIDPNDGLLVDAARIESRHVDSGSGTCPECVAMGEADTAWPCAFIKSARDIRAIVAQRRRMTGIVAPEPHAPPRPKPKPVRGYQSPWARDAPRQP